MADAVARGDDADAGKCGLRPFQEGIALAVALEFDFHVLAQCVLRVAHVDDNRMVDHEIDRHKRLDPCGVELLAHRFGAHGGEIVQRRKAGHVLEHDAGEHEGDFRGARFVWFPGGERAHGVFSNAFAVAVAQHRFKHHTQAHRHARRFAEARLLEGREQ